MVLSLQLLYSILLILHVTKLIDSKQYNHNQHVYTLLKAKQGRRTSDIYARQIKKGKLF